MTTTEPQGLMFASITVGDTPAAETAVCAEHRPGFVPAPAFGDVEDLTLQDCSAVGTLTCTVCGRDADEVASSGRDPLDGSSVAYLAREGQPLDVTDEELTAGIEAAEHWLANAQREHKRADAVQYRKIVALLWAEQRVRYGWQAGNDGTGKRIWFVYRETRAGTEYVEGSNGRVTRFATCDAARRRAFALNGKPEPVPMGY